MRTLGMLLFSFLLSTPLMVSADSITVYAWVADNGTISFTDNMDNVPERYLNRFKIVELESIEDYERYTHVDTTVEPVCESD